jgi:hypothetical protein
MPDPGCARESITKAAVFRYLMAPSLFGGGFGVAQLTASRIAIMFRLRFQGSERHTRGNSPGRQSASFAHWRFCCRK